MYKIIGMIAAAVVLAAAGAVVFINSTLQPAEFEEAELDRIQINVKDDRTGIGEPEEMTDNREYVENQVVAVAESKREAKKIAKQIGGELLSYDNQVAVIQIGVTVEEMMQQLEEDSSLPRVYPNYQGYENYTN